MISRLATMTAVLAMAVGASAWADAWTLDGSTSKLAFGSIKSDSVGEVNSFEALTGTVSADGAVAIDIDLNSVQTYIDIRNERMVKYVFEAAPSAKLAAQIDMAAMNGLAVGANTITDVEGTLSFLGARVDIEAEMFVARLSETQVMASTNDMVFVSTDDLGINPGIDKLMEIAELPGITRAVPVTMRLVFTAGDAQAAATPATTPAAPAATEETPVVTAAAAGGDADAGKRVFRKCRACHKLEEGDHGVGPSLYQIVGRPAGQAEGFKYSDAMANSGIVWDEASLSAFLAKPREYVKGTSMAFAGLRKEEEVVNIIAYLTNPE